MTTPAKVTPSMTKKEIIEEYNRLLDEFKKEAAAHKEAENRLSELEKKKDHEAIDVGLQTTVDSVLEGISRLRALVGATLNDLGDKMAEQAEKLERLNRAVNLQEARLKDLYNIEYAADTMSKLATAYAEEKERIEAEYTSRTSELAKEFAARKAELEQEIEKKRAQWKLEEEERAKEREREQAEYEYNRDRERRLEENTYAEKKAALEKELHSMKEEAEREIAEREKAVALREEEFQRMSAEIEEFPRRMEATVQKARKEAIAKLQKEFEHKAALLNIEREWERKSLEQTIAHLQEVNRSLEEKLNAISAELSEAYKQLNAIAEKAVEGTSMAKAFESVNQIATKQSRTLDRGLKE